MSRLAEFLQTWAQEERTKAEANKPIVEEWRSAVASIITQMEFWLREADPGHVLRIEPYGIEKHEERLGFYHVRGLLIRHVAREVKVVPIARIVMSAPADGLLLPTNRPEGRVDITDGATRYKMYRLLNGTESRWVVYEERHPLRTFDKQVFEDIMMDLLQ